MNTLETNEEVCKNSRERIIQAIHAGAKPDLMLPLLHEINRALGCPEVYPKSENEENWTRHLEKLEEIVRKGNEGFDGVTIHLGGGSSRLFLGWRGFKANPDEKVEVYLTKKSEKVEQAWKKLQ